ncbi:MAG TPA: MMPL family transporter, partial [Candidatus Limnocylindrales bacterium]|nr:MMPL family transporter [Candidatus Limnocylindrales bacterium]
MIVAITGRAVRGLVALSCRRPIVTVAACALLAVLSMAYTDRALTIQTSKLLLLPERARYVTLFRAYAEDFGTMGDLAVVVRAPRVAESVAFAEALVARLRTGPAHFERIAHRVDPRSLKGGALLYLPLGQIQRLHDTFAEHHELLEAFVARPTLDQLLEGVNQQVAAGFVAHVFDVGLQEAPVSTDMRLVRELVSLMGRRLDGDRAYRSPWGALLAGGGDSEVGYLLSENRQLLFILLTPAVKGEDFTAVRDALRFVRREIAGLRAQYPTVTAGVTGAPALYNDELAKAFEDSELAGVIASVLTLLVLVIAFRQIQQPVLMLIVLGVSLAWAMGMVALTIGYLTVFSVMFLSIVIGIGIDYGMYFLYRYQEERAAGHDLGPAIALTAERNGPAILASIAAAAATFYVLAITDFKGVREFGFISGTAVLLAGLAMLTMFPALLVLSERRRGARTVPAVPAGEVVVLERLARRPRRVLIPAAAAALLAAVSLPWLEVDYNILNLQAKGTESVEWEKIVLKTAGWSGFPAVTTAGSLDELATRHAAFARLPSVSEVKSVVTLIPDRQAEKIALIQRLAPLVPELRVTAPSEVDLPRLVAAVAGLKRRLDLAATADLPRALAEEVTATVTGVSALLDRFRGGDPAPLTAGLGDLQRDLYRDVTGQFEILRESLRPAPITPADLPEEIRRRFVGTS